MKIVILAAGKGSRLGMDTPKALVELTKGEKIIDLQIERLSKHISLENIFLVVGFMQEKVRESHPELKYIFNERYDCTNTGKSLLKALEHIGTEDDILWLNGDVVFDAEIIPKLIKTNESCVLVDNKKCDVEEVKYTTGSTGYIDAISKTVSNPEGEALGINIIKSKHLPLFKRHLIHINDDDYFEKAIENMIKKDVIEIIPVNVDGLFCHEIDFPQDLEYVKERV